MAFLLLKYHPLSPTRNSSSLIWIKWNNWYPKWQSIGFALDTFWNIEPGAKKCLCFNNYCKLVWTFRNETIIKVVTVNGSSFIDKTQDLTITVYVFAVDNGIPRRGDYFPLSVKYDVSCNVTGKVAVNSTTGDVYFTAPRMTVYNKDKFRHCMWFNEIFCFSVSHVVLCTRGVYRAMSNI